jgi:tRNA 2-thiocytidine biosynthesis protein TtcA
MDSIFKIEREAHKLEKRLCREAGKAIVQYNMIEEGDKVMVCMSGGKDSYTLLDILLKLKARAPIHFELIAVNLDQKQPGFPEHVLPDYLRSVGVPFHIENEDTYSIVKRLIPEGKTTCSLCSRLRRGILYRVADELGATKIALGHHRDDILATLLLNMFFGGKLKSMPPKLVSDDGRHVVIRPLAFVAEKDTTQWAKVRQFPIIPCNLCGSQENLQRKQVGEMLREWQKKYPGRVENMFNALQNVVPSHLLDGALYDFKGARATGVADDNGDKAFDAEDFPEPLRAWDTAISIATLTGLDVRTVEGLRERGFGVFEGKTFHEIETHWPEQAQRWRKRDPEFAPDGGESLTALRERIVQTTHALAARHPGEQIVLVAHGGVMDVLYRAATRQDIQAPRTWDLGNAAINRLLWTPDGLSLVGWADTRHLDATAGLDESST